jgi:valyl-tRNA synthetase
VWNAFRLVQGWQVDGSLQQPAESAAAVGWFRERFREQLSLLNDHYAKYRMSDALMCTYKLIWDDFCAWYLEIVKPAMGAGMDAQTHHATVGFFEDLLKVLHPWMPFITEELYHHLGERSDRDCIIVSEWPKASEPDPALLEAFAGAQETITQVRNLRKTRNIPFKDQLRLLRRSEGTINSRFDAVIMKMANLEALETTQEKVAGALSFLVGKTECFLPVSGGIDVEAEKQRLLKELDYNKGFLKSVQSKLANERFVSNAKPEVVEIERRKQSDAEAKIRAIEEQLAALG